MTSLNSLMFAYATTKWQEAGFYGGPVILAKDDNDALDQAQALGVELEDDIERVPVGIGTPSNID